MVNPPDAARPWPGRALFAISAMGLGHAQRSLPLIRRLLAQGTRLTIISHGDALLTLRQELAGQQAVDFMSVPDYPPLQRGAGLAHYGYFFADLMGLARRVRAEHAITARQVAEMAPDIIIADGRFGFYAKGVPSFLICHQIRIILPRLLRPFQFIADIVQFFLLRRYDKVLVPDFPTREASLAGSLSHNWIARLLKPAYVGHLSSVQYRKAERDIDLLFLAGGFLEGPRAEWEAWVARFAREHKAQRIVSILGRMGGSSMPVDDSIQHDFVTGAARDALMNRARRIIARAGYTTIMDLIELRQDAILLPTPSMTEQSYLARRYPQTDIAGSIGYAFRYADLPEAIRTWRVEDTLDGIQRAIGARHRD
jgi:hypothetical protein